MKKFLALLVATMMVLSLTACSTPTAPAAKPAASAAPAPAATPAPSVAPAPAATPAEEEQLKVAIILPSSPQDGGWGQFGAEGMQYAADKLGAKLAIVEATASDVITTETEALADDGYRVIIGHGGEYSTAFGEISPDYPNTDFISIGGNICKENQFSLQIATETVAFVQGVVAAKLSKTGIVGTINAMDIPSFTKTNKAFEAGAKHINPDIKVLYTVMTVYGDPNEGYEIARSQIAEGADHINSNADLACYGIAKACKEKGVTFSGYGAKFDEYPETVLNSIDNDFGPAFLAVINRCLNKAAEPITEALSVGIGDGAVLLKTNEELYATLPADVQTAMEDFTKPLLNGEIPLVTENDLY